jgi:3-oxoacyl-[acyl-carrier protein] reductase
MKFLISILATIVVATSGFTATSFIPRPSTLGVKSSSSSLQMVADDAKVILVTGSSRGLGKSIALAMGGAGQKVVVNYVSDRSKEAAEATAEEIKSLGGDAMVVQADSSSVEGVDKMFAQIVEKFGTVDVLVNNAGITKDTLVMRMKPEQWQAVIDINLTGVFYCTKAFFKIASKNRSGRIINISSVVGQIGNPGQANYAAAKGGVLGLTRSNAKEFASRGVTVNAICPGFIATDMVGKLDPEYLKSVADTIPLKRLGKPEEIAGMAKFLALDPAADYITGHTFNVDGGIAIGA